ncbi:hypothetical protein NBRC111894_3331 [Sporolactobacillus inulinus]|uniref:Uncharacterized protein n=1 Tax=Sporolactobacillus inulinus TaxID=2078 RepID=A0A4Y1ZF75_9BACL|nr:hypothetical protein NBRC111894_3331 [Sporolactobacillus inulinus]
MLTARASPHPFWTLIAALLANINGFVFCHRITYPSLF